MCIRDSNKTGIRRNSHGIIGNSAGTVLQLWHKQNHYCLSLIHISYGDSHPGSGHLNILVEEVRKGVAQAGGFGARYYVTDICDGESQGTDGINFSLASREMIANMIEIQGNATVSDAGVYLASCDKGMPGNLMGLARVNIPSVVVPGGTMNAGQEMLTLEQLGMYSAKYQRGEIDEEKLDWAK